MKNAEPKTIDEMAAEFAALEKAAAAKRAELQRAQEAENLRRSPLRELIEKRKNLQAKIVWAKSTIEGHKMDSDEFEKMVDSFFNTPTGNQPRTYNFIVPTLNYPFAAASRAVELLSVRLDKAKKEMTLLEAKIVAEASSLGLEEMLPAELRK